MADLLKLIVILGITVALLIKKWDLGLVLLFNTVLIALLFAFPPLALGGSILGALVAEDTLGLVGAVYLVLMLAELMRRTQAMENMVASLQVLVPDGRLTLALMPLMIGLLPMIGGAMFSAPMVNEVGARLDVTPARKTFINYWFRHAMEYIFPLYSSLLMMAALMEISVYDFIRVSWPLTVVALMSGVIWGVGGLRQHYKFDSVQTRSDALRGFLVSTWPLILVVLLVVVLKLNMVLSLIGVIVLYTVVSQIGPQAWWDVVKRSFPIHTFSAIFGVMIFKHVMEDAGAVTQIPGALSQLGLPVMVIAFAVPMIVGLLTGTAAAALALSVPLVAPLLATQSIEPMAAGVWLFAGGFSGVLLSPLHLCLALTRDYFGASWGPIYRRIVPSVALVAVAALGIVLLRQ